MSSAFDSRKRSGSQDDVVQPQVDGADDVLASAAPLLDCERASGVDRRCQRHGDMPPAIGDLYVVSELMDVSVGVGVVDPQVEVAIVAKSVRR